VYSERGNLERAVYVEDLLQEPRRAPREPRPVILLLPYINEPPRARPPRVRVAINAAAAPAPPPPAGSTGCTRIHSSAGRLLRSSAAL
jgi:hypothetical protein